MNIYAMECINIQCTARLVKALPGQICPTPHGFAPPYHSRASAGPKKPKRSPGPAWRRKLTGDLPKRVTWTSCFLPFLTWETASAFQCTDILSFFYIFASLCLHHPPAATGRTGRRAETALPFRFGPLAPLPCGSSQPLGGG